jgi:hypothetical protein
LCGCLTLEAINCAQVKIGFGTENYDQMTACCQSYDKGASLGFWRPCWKHLKRPTI